MQYDTCQLSVQSTGVSVDVSAVAATAKEAWYNQRRLYRQLRRRKSSEFWSRKIDADRADPKSLWRSVDNLLGRGRVPASELMSKLSTGILMRKFLRCG